VYVQATEVKLEQVNFNAEFISRMIPRLEWPAICAAAESVSFLFCLIAAAAAVSTVLSTDDSS